MPIHEPSLIQTYPWSFATKGVVVHPLLHTLELELHPVPIRFHILCVDSGSGVNKMQRKIDCFVLLNIH